MESSNSWPAVTQSAKLKVMIKQDNDKAIENRSESASAPVDRSFEMLLAGYYLSRCGARADSGADGPPAALNAQSWKQAYNLFFDAMGDGRSPERFRNSLKNARDTFDALFDNGRTGWITKIPPGFQRIHDEWRDRPDSALERLLLQMLSGVGEEDEPTGAVVRTEGGQKVMVSKRRERDPRLRAEAIRLHGTCCKACGFNFRKAYGELGQGFIEVHHAVPLSETGLAETDPATDLTVLCANCHRMVHRKKGICLTIDELQSTMTD